MTKIDETHISIRPAAPDQAESVSSLTNAAYSKYIPLIGRKPQPMTADYVRMVVENSVWLLWVDDQLAGVLVLIYETAQVLIYSVAIVPEYQKQGLGRRLLAWAELQAIADGYTSIRLYTNARFEDNIGLYKRLGYQETGRRSLLNSIVVDMAKNLGADKTTKNFRDYPESF